MRLWQGTSFADGCRWGCRRPHKKNRRRICNKEVSVRAGTIFDDFNLSLPELVISSFFQSYMSSPNSLTLLSPGNHFRILVAEVQSGTDFFLFSQNRQEHTSPVDETLPECGHPPHVGSGIWRPKHTAWKPEEERLSWSFSRS